MPKPMSKITSITLSHHDFTALREISGGHVSEKIREILEGFEPDSVKDLIESDKTTVRINDDISKKLCDTANKLGVKDTGRIVRAVVENYIHTHH